MLAVDTSRPVGPLLFVSLPTRLGQPAFFCSSRHLEHEETYSAHIHPRLYTVLEWLFCVFEASLMLSSKYKE
jgi:hypothetical protein